MDEAKALGRRVRELRCWRGLTLRESAGLAGLSFSFWGQVERGEKPITERRTLEALAGALRVHPTELTGQPWIPQDLVGAGARRVLDRDPALASVGAAQELDMTGARGRAAGLQMRFVDLHPITCVPLPRDGWRAGQPCMSGSPAARRALDLAPGTMPIDYSVSRCARFRSPRSLDGEKPGSGAVPPGTRSRHG